MMPVHFKFLSVAIVAMVMSACASLPLPNHIDKAARPLFDTVETYLIVTQDQIYAEPVKSHYSGFYEGSFMQQMLWISFSERQKKAYASFAESIAVPIQDNMQDYDFAQVLTENLNTKLGEIDWLNAKDLVLLRSAEEDLYSSKSISSRASAILFIRAIYALAPDFSDVIVRVAAVMYPNTDALESYKAKNNQNENPVVQGDNIYRNNFVARIPLKVEGLVKDRGKILSGNGAEAVKSALTQCAEELSEYIGRDLARDETTEQK